ncbi:hypothetical protein L3Q82_020056 [Scortum barcoo]|uniref:Uncharacterized protein n=1 Tax=Scortum barcoo TaxID=214431 RepID=A0ACB8VF69_9TELE|nr:hypothetical protein L3Q82_020056 [Scortum barcoo]
MSLGWPGNAYGIPPEELEEVSGVREVWASLLRLLPPRDPVPDQADESGWMFLIQLKLCGVCFTLLDVFFVSSASITTFLSGFLCFFRRVSSRLPESDSKVEAVEGDSVSLLCRLDPPDSVVNNAVDWKKVDLNTVVYAYRNKKENQKDQVAEYRGRANVSLEGLNAGNMTLWISSLKTSDSGPYRCFTSKLMTSCKVSLTVVPKAQQNGTKREDFSTTAPPTHDDEPGAENVKHDRHIISTIVGVSIFVVIIIVVVLVRDVERSSVEAEEGEDVTLRYRLDPPIDLSAYTVDVRRADSRDGVHAYRHRQDHLYDQADRYRGRTALVHEDLSRGILTLQVSSVKQADGGPYRFLVPKLGVSCTVHLSVGRAGVIVAAVLSFILLCFVVLLVVRKRAILSSLMMLTGGVSK